MRCESEQMKKRFCHFQPPGSMPEEKDESSLMHFSKYEATKSLGSLMLPWPKPAVEVVHVVE
jgi:hypothetical protein